jgi:peptidoglycan hydrolase-like protein with peptidoglycan-binding domain
MSGDSVVEIQTKLNEKGGYNLETKTKKFGTNTKNALIDFQNKNNITPAQGVFGPKTWRVLFGSVPELETLKSRDYRQTQVGNVGADNPSLVGGTQPIQTITQQSSGNNKPGVKNVTSSGKIR